MYIIPEEIGYTMKKLDSVELLRLYYQNTEGMRQRAVYGVFDSRGKLAWWACSRRGAERYAYRVNAWEGSSTVKLLKRNDWMA